MFRHVAMFRWLPGTTADQVRELRDGLAALPAAIPELRSYRTGPDAGLTDGNWDFVVVADFDDADGWRTYLAHPDHQKVLADLIRPMVSERAAAQYEY